MIISRFSDSNFGIQFFEIAPWWLLLLRIIHPWDTCDEKTMELKKISPFTYSIWWCIWIWDTGCKLRWCYPRFSETLETSEFLILLLYEDCDSCGRHVGRRWRNAPLTLPRFGRRQVRRTLSSRGTRWHSWRISLIQRLHRRTRSTSASQ